jgi:hypothetical protein
MVFLSILVPTIHRISIMQKGFEAFGEHIHPSKFTHITSTFPSILDKDSIMWRVLEAESARPQIAFSHTNKPIPV